MVLWSWLFLVFIPFILLHQVTLLKQSTHPEYSWAVSSIVWELLQVLLKNDFLAIVRWRNYSGAVNCQVCEQALRCPEYLREVKVVKAVNICSLRWCVEWRQLHTLPAILGGGDLSKVGAPRQYLLPRQYLCLAVRSVACGLPSWYIRYL